MNRIKKLAAGLNFAAGAWTVAVVLWLTGETALCVNTMTGCAPQSTYAWPNGALIVLGILLALDSVACFRGFSFSYPLGAVLSVLVALLTANGWAGWTGLAAPFHVSLFIVSLLAFVFNLVAILSRERMPEQGNPLNLPVFG